MPKPKTVSKEIHQPIQSTSVSKEIQGTNGLPVDSEMVEVYASLATKQRNQFPSQLRNHQIVRYLAILEELGNPVTAATMIGLNIRTVQKWRNKSQAFSKKYDDALRLGDWNMEHQITGKMDQEILTQPFDKVTSLLAMFRAKKLNPAYKDSQQININTAGPAMMQFVVHARDDASKQIVQADDQAAT